MFVLIENWLAVKVEFQANHFNPIQKIYKKSISINSDIIDVQ